MRDGFTTPANRSADLVAFAPALFERADLDPDKAGTVAEVLVEGDLLGHSTHGLALAAPFLAALADGSMPARARPRSCPIMTAPRAGTDAVCPGGGRWWRRSRRRSPRADVRHRAVTIRESHHTGCLARISSAPRPEAA
jgi:hypothetical protein